MSTERTTSPEPRSQARAALAASAIVGLSMAYLAYHFGSQKIASLQGQTRAMLVATQHVQRHMAEQASTEWTPTAAAAPYFRDIAEVAKRLPALAQAPHERPTWENVDGQHPFFREAFLATLAGVRESSPSEFSRRACDAAWQESERMAAHGLTFPSVESLLQRQMASALTPEESERWLRRSLGQHAGDSADANRPMLSRDPTEAFRSDNTRWLEFVTDPRIREDLGMRRSSEAFAQLGQAWDLEASGASAEALAKYESGWSLARRDGARASELSWAGSEYALALLQSGRAEEALAVADEAADRIARLSEPRESVASIRVVITRVAALRALDRTVEAAHAWAQASLAIDFERSIERRFAPSGLAAPLASAGEVADAQAVLCKDLLAAYLANDRAAARMTVLQADRLAASLPAMDGALRSALPVYRRWLLGSPK